MEQLRKPRRGRGECDITQGRKPSRTFRNQDCPRQAGSLYRLPSNLGAGHGGPPESQGLPKATQQGQAGLRCLRFRARPSRRSPSL